jgi:predicted kinase
VADDPILHLVCGKIAAGKSTLARRLGGAPGTVLIAEDAWLSRLYGDELRTVADYARYSRRLREPMGDHVAALLRAGLSVVLDFPANTVAVRQWMHAIAERAGVRGTLHFLDVPDDVCRARLKSRNAAGTHEYAATDAEFDEITSYFTAPTADEGFDIIAYRGGDRHASTM